jgi:hypothetical protein
MGVEAIRVDRDPGRADDWIITHASVDGADTLTVARIEELLDPRMRRSLADGFARIASDVEARDRFMWMPITVDPRRLARHVGDLHLLAKKLNDVDSPVSPRGVALAYRLLTDGAGPLYQAGPLYDARRARQLATALSRTLGYLDVDRS